MFSPDRTAPVGLTSSSQANMCQAHCLDREETIPDHRHRKQSEHLAKLKQMAGEKRAAAARLTRTGTRSNKETASRQGLLVS